VPDDDTLRLPGELSWDEFRRMIRKDVKVKESDVPDDELLEMFQCVLC
jgi:hypothetical protein